jgi:hypothetical protein
MDPAEALAFARKTPHAVLATMKRDGTPQRSQAAAYQDKSSLI